MPAGGDQQVFARQRLSANLHGMRVNNAGTADDDVDSGILQQLGVNAVQPDDFLVLVGQQGIPVEVRVFH